MLLAPATALGRTAATLQCRAAWCRNFGVFARRVYARPDYTPYAGFSRSAVDAVDLAALIPQRLKEAAACDETLPATVILHGLLGSANNWRSLINRDDLLAGRFVCALDLRNHGRSPHSDSMTYKEMAADGAAMSSGEIVQFVDRHLGVREISLIGHSMGGKVAMELALTYPERVANLVVVDIAPVPYDSTLMHTAIIEAMSSIDVPSLKNVNQGRDALAKVISDAETREFVLTNLVMDAETKTYKWKVNVASLLHHLHNRDLIGFSPPGGELCQPWVGPCLWIKGTRSSYVDPTRHMETMKRFFPGTELCTMETGHWPHHQQPQEFLSTVNHWFTKQGRGLS